MKHRGQSAPDEDEPIPFWPTAPKLVRPVYAEPTVPCAVCPNRINPRREVHYSTSDGLRRWCAAHGVTYGPGLP